MTSRAPVKISMTFDSNQDLWLANNGSSSDLIIIDAVTGGWEYDMALTQTTKMILEEQLMI